MFARITLVLVLLAATDAWSQVEPGATGGATTPESNYQMLVPAPVSGAAYSSQIGSETQTNYLTASVAVYGGYVDNVLPSQTGTPVNDATFSVRPTVAISRTTPRQGETFSYTPTFSFYQPTSVLDTVDQGANLVFQERLSPSVTLSLQDNFFRSSDVFDQSYLFSAGAITGSTQTPTSTLIVPFTEELTNTANAVISYQFGRDGMVGGGGADTTADFPNATTASGISNSNQSSGMAFYSRRLFRSQYMGFTYQYSRTTSELGSQHGESQTNSLLPFYTIYFSPTCSFSVSAGVERLNVTLAQPLTSNSWSPSGAMSLGWQGNRANLAASYTHTVNSGVGLLGAYNINAVGASGGWRLASSWTVALSAFYTNQTNATPQISSYPGGTMIAGQASLRHTLGEHFVAAFGYQRLHEDYSNIPLIAENPDSDQEYGQIAYQFKMPLRK